MNATTLELYDIFRKSMPETEAREAAHVLKEFVRAEKMAEVAKEAEILAEKAVARETKGLATNAGLQALREDMHALREDMHAMEKSIRKDMGKMENKLVYWLIGIGVTILLAIYSTSRGQQSQPTPASQQTPAAAHGSPGARGIPAP